MKKYESAYKLARNTQYWIATQNHQQIGSVGLSNGLITKNQQATRKSNKMQTVKELAEKHIIKLDLSEEVVQIPANAQQYFASHNMTNYNAEFIAAVLIQNKGAYVIDANKDSVEFCLPGGNAPDMTPVINSFEQKYAELLKKEKLTKDDVEVFKRDFGRFYNKELAKVGYTVKLSSDRRSQ
jgi:hypothetical protein